MKGAVVGVAFHDLETADSLFVNADDSFHAASTMKVPVMIELFRRVDAGGLRLDQGILLVNQFGSIVDGSPYSLDAGDDSDSSPTLMVGSARRRPRADRPNDHAVEQPGDERAHRARRSGARQRNRARARGARTFACSAASRTARRSARA